MKTTAQIAGTLGLVTGLVLGGLTLTGCSTYIAAEEWRCVDENRQPLSGVIATYGISGLDAGAHFEREGGYEISDANGMLHLPADTVPKSKLTGNAGRRVSVLYSENMHASSFMLGRYREAIVSDFASRTFIIEDVSNDPARWYLSLRNLLFPLHYANLLVSDRVESVRFCLDSILPPIAAREKELFLKKFGQNYPDSKISTIVEDMSKFAREHDVRPTEITYTMLVSNLKP